MLSKCMNPACEARFLYLREGRLFRLPVRHPKARASSSDRTEYFWLCSACARTMTVVSVYGKVFVQPLSAPSQNQAKAASGEE